MFGPKSKSLVQLEHYLETRSSYRSRDAVNAGWGAGMALAAIGSVVAFAGSAPPQIGVGLLCAAGILGARYAFTKPKASANATDRVFEQAQAVADKMHLLSTKRRLHLAMHAGIAETLNECAGFWQRIRLASDRKLWEEKGVEPHWLAARADWEKAADLAMAEALLLADSSMLQRPPRPRAEEVVEDLLDTYVFKRPVAQEPLPPSFEPLRALAEKLRQLATEVETATRRLAKTERSEPTADASKRLDEVLGELRSIHDAESELRQDLRS